MKWELFFSHNNVHGWWDCEVGNVTVGVYRLTEHGWWDVRTIYYARDEYTERMLLPAPDYTEQEIRNIVESAWTIYRGEQDVQS